MVQPNASASGTAGYPPDRSADLGKLEMAELPLHRIDRAEQKHDTQQRRRVPRDPRQPSTRADGGSRLAATRSQDAASGRPWRNG